MTSYAEAVEALRTNPANAELVAQCYLDQDVTKAAERFFSSEEFGAVRHLLSLEQSALDVLDLGCGNGIAAYAIARLGHLVSAVDPDESENYGLGAVRRLSIGVTPGKITPFRAHAESLPFPDLYFDRVYVRQALHHFSELDLGLTETARVIKRGGLFLAAREHVAESEAEKQIFLAGHPLHALHGGENAYALGKYQAALREAGFQVLNVLAPFDSVINHFPVSNQELRHWLRKGAERRLGIRLGSFVSALAPVERLYRRRLSRTCRTPGRMYSFLCLKR